MAWRHGGCSLCFSLRLWSHSRTFRRIDWMMLECDSILPFHLMRKPPLRSVAPAAKSRPGFLLDVLSGLEGLTAISPRWFYDQEGSKLFEDITGCRSTTQLVASVSICRRTSARSRHPGAQTGCLLSSVRAPPPRLPVLLGHAFGLEYIATTSWRVPARIHCVSAGPISAHSHAACRGDFQVRDGAAAYGPAARWRRIFPGSTLWQPERSGCCRSPSDVWRPLVLIPLCSWESTTEGRGNPPCLYDDLQGVTARFNLNLLHRINREPSATSRCSPSHEVR